MFNPINISIAKVNKIKIRDTRYPDYKIMEIFYEDDTISVIDIHAPRGLTTEIE